MIRSKLPKGDGTHLGAGAAAPAAVMRSTCKAVMCGQPCHLSGQGWGSAGGTGALPWLGPRGGEVTQLSREACVEFQGHGKGREHRVLPASAVLPPKFAWHSALAGS